MEKRMTKRDYFAMVKEIVENAETANREELIAFIEHEVELLDRKSAKSGETKTQKENASIMKAICSALAEIGKPVTISELQNASDEMAEYSNQKLSALLKKLIDSGEVVKTIEKKKSYFSVAEGE